MSSVTVSPKGGWGIGIKNGGLNRDLVIIWEVMSLLWQYLPTWVLLPGKGLCLVLISFSFYIYLFILCACTHTHAHKWAHMYAIIPVEGREQFVLSFYHLGSRDCTQAVWFGDKGLYPLDQPFLLFCLCLCFCFLSSLRKGFSGDTDAWSRSSFNKAKDSILYSGWRLERVHSDVGMEGGSWQPTVYCGMDFKYILWIFMTFVEYSWGEMTLFPWSSWKAQWDCGRVSTIM